MLIAPSCVHPTSPSAGCSAASDLPLVAVGGGGVYRGRRRGGTVGGGGGGGGGGRGWRREKGGEWAYL